VAYKPIRARWAGGVKKIAIGNEEIDAIDRWESTSTFQSSLSIRKFIPLAALKRDLLLHVSGSRVIRLCDSERPACFLADGMKQLA
jgi:hypothetical protein